MDVQLARQYHAKLQELLNELRDAESIGERAPTVQRMENLNRSLYTVHSGAAQHIEEALRKLKYPELAVVRAAHATIAQQLHILGRTIDGHPEAHFVRSGTERIFARPVHGDELRSAVERGRLFDEQHNLYLHAFEADPHVEELLLELDAATLRPALSRLGFPGADAILIFRTRAIPSVVAPLESIPSMRVAKLRTGIPVSVLKHRIL